jgi:hypothetical protein
VAGSLYSGNQQKKAAQGATNAQVAGQQASIAEQKRQYDLSRADQMPWLNAGKGALGQMQTLNSGDYSSFNASPDYQWTLSEGMKGLDRSAAAKGRMYSGGYGEDLTRYAQGAASTQYNNYYNKLANMAGVGSSTATQLGGLGQNYANAFGNAQTNMGDARASGYANKSNSNSNMMNQIGGIASNYFGSSPSWGFGSSGAQIQPYSGTSWNFGAPSGSAMSYVNFPGG